MKTKYPIPLLPALGLALFIGGNTAAPAENTNLQQQVDQLSARLHFEF